MDTMNARLIFEKNASLCDQAIEILDEFSKEKQSMLASLAGKPLIGMYCMAVPVRNYTGKIVAAVSASIPVFRVDDKKKEFVLDELNRTVGQISKELGYRG